MDSGKLVTAGDPCPGVSSEKATTIWADFNGGTVRSVIKPEKVGEMLTHFDAFMEERSLTWGEAMLFVASTLKKYRHSVSPETLFGALLWLACRSPDDGEIAEAAARQGGKSIGYEITSGEDGYNFRLRIHDGHLSQDRAFVSEPVAGHA